ncbi:MAG: pilus assembly protein [Nocardioidaceae bacterium]|nr:pilus assembly protein [Nocardioidaceae bacterium]NUS52943.1 pilus assembly protein [Nocardioidaceae bacterium]
MSLFGVRRGERGSMAVEIVILAPVMLAFLMLIVECGRFVSVRGDLEATTRDAARAASLERDTNSALGAARSVVAASLDKGTTDCRPATLSGNFVAGGYVQVNLSCRVPLDGLGLLDLGASAPIEVHSAAPIDTYRRTG